MKVKNSNFVSANLAISNEKNKPVNPAVNHADSLKENPVYNQEGLPVLDSVLADPASAKIVEQFLQKNIGNLLREKPVNGKVNLALLKAFIDPYPNLVKSLSSDFLRLLDHILDDPIRLHRILKDLLTAQAWEGLSSSDISETIYVVEDVRDLLLEAHLQNLKKK